MADKKLNHTIAEITDAHPEHKMAATIRYIGLALFFIGFLVFIATLSINTYTLTPEKVNKVITNKAQRIAVKAQLQPKMGKEYSSVFTFVGDLKTALQKADKQLDKKQQMGSYQQGQYRIYLTKAAGSGLAGKYNGLLFWLSIGLACFGALMYHLPRLAFTKPGIQNDHIFQNPAMRGKVLGVIFGGALMLFYVMLYWYPEYIANWIRLVDPLSYALQGKEADQWFLYGTLYTLAILVMGVRMFIKYRHSKYHLVRTSSVMFFQTAFAFILPAVLVALNQPSADLKNIWPLHYDFFFGYNLDKLAGSGSLGIFMLVWGIVLIIIGVPLITYFYGKRWYCSWVCGCGGLAETLGDPYRQLSDKSKTAWKIERWLVHSVLVFAVVMTAAVLYTYFTGSGSLLGVSTASISSVYGFAIGSIFAGVIGVGFYPFMGSRMWCRFGCPLAAYLGIVQRFKSRFRITTNGGQCISCGNCSTYCEMGIDVRWYAQRGQNIVRASCVGCGVCASVCPRGVLKLENGSEKGRFNQPKAFTITDDGIEMNKEIAA